MYPIAIIGSGVAALSSAIYAGQGGVPAVVFEGDYPGGNLVQSNNVTNMPGSRAKSGQELIHTMYLQAKDAKTKFIPAIISATKFDEFPFILYTPTPVRCWSVIICTGTTANKLNIPGETKFWKKGIYSCPTCETSKIRGKIVVVIGGGDSAVAKALFASNLAKVVYVFVRSPEFHCKKDVSKLDRLLKHPKIKVFYKTTVTSFEGKSNLTGIVVNNHDYVACHAAFVAIGSYPNIQAFPQLKKQDGALWVDPLTQETSIQGIFAAGDVCDITYNQAVTAAAAGTRAALNCLKFYQQINFPKGSQQRLIPKLMKGTYAIVITSSSCPNCAMKSDKIQAFKDQAEHNGFKFALLDVDEWNPKLEQFFKKFKLDNEMDLPEFLVIKDGKIAKRFK